MNRNKKFVVGITVIVATVLFLVYTAVDETKMYMLTVSEYLDDTSEHSGQTVRVAGRVGAGTIAWAPATLDLRFTLGDIEGSGSIDVHSAGLLPDMFAEDRDVIVEGNGGGGEVFEAGTILTSCPSKYEPEQAMP